MRGHGLLHYNEFREILEHYHVSDRAKQALKGLKLVLLVGPTSTGRNTIIRYLVKHFDYYFIISDTTRQPQVRDGRLEQNGVDYYFRSEEDALADLKAGEFLEAAIIHEQQVSGRSIRELERAKILNRIAIADVETVGANKVMHASTDAKAVFLVPPSFEHWMDRIASRGHMSDRELRNRLTSAAIEFEDALRHDYYNFVVADSIERAAKTIDAIAHGKPNPQQGRGIELIHQLQYRLQQKLDSMKYI